MPTADSGIAQLIKCLLLGRKMDGGAAEEDSEWMAFPTLIL